MPSPGPDFTLADGHRTLTGEWQVLVRVAGGQQVKVTVPAVNVTPEGIADAVAVAILRMPGPPGPDT